MMSTTSSGRMRCHRDSNGARPPAHPAAQPALAPSPAGFWFPFSFPPPSLPSATGLPLAITPVPRPPLLRAGTRAVPPPLPGGTRDCPSLRNVRWIYPFGSIRWICPLTDSPRGVIRTRCLHHVEVAWTEVSSPTPGSAEPPVRWWPAAPALPPAEAGRGTTHRPPSSRSRFKSPFPMPSGGTVQNRVRLA